MATKKIAKAGAKASPTKKTDFENAATKAGLAIVAGKHAVKGEYRDRITVSAGNIFTHSVDIDSHYKQSEGASPRWDYAVGIKSGANIESAFWIEPHPANSTGEVKKMIEKLVWLKKKLETEGFSDLRKLRDSAATKGVSPYRWLATDATIRVTASSKEARLLALNGLDMPRRTVHLT
ncbi:hypothetical protein [Comamonas sp. UBA7528]|uniref:hypothetical protein n=1 Tax=Comamonas sp. UBA7528 TaxID=1946391 RepID=UPI0025BF3A8E|nr:hypothetical protein [Comamonas sp. UBA7528]